MKLDLHYVDPRLVELYDIDNPRAADTDFYLALARRLQARRIVDLGCGTGTLTIELAAPGREVIGVDPSIAMLGVAQHKPGAEHVQWVVGDAQVLGTAEADLALMTGNVAQVFLDDAEWARTLRALHGALRTGGYLAFESRNPAVQAWDQWNRAASYEQIDSLFGPLECWLEVVEVVPGRVRFEGHNVFTATGEHVVASSQLRFRSKAELAASVAEAGFRVEEIYGNWQAEPATDSSRFFVFVARR